MDELEKKQVRFREPPSVPFLWELRPGIPKRDWKPEPPPSSSSSYSSSSSSAAASVSHVLMSPPIKLVTSIPFSWEEKPGTPIAHYSSNSEAKLIDMTSSFSPPPCSSSAAAVAASVSQVPKSPIKLYASIPFAWEEKPGTPIRDFPLNPEAKPNDLESSSSSSSSSSASAYHVAWKESSCDINFDEGSDIDDSVINLEPESFGGCSDSDPSLPANCAVASSDKLPIEIPLRKSSLSEQFFESSCSSPASENESSTSSYETGGSNLVGASFLETLFPLFPPKTGFLEKAGSSSTPLELKQSRDFDGEEDNSSAMLRKPPTLGELIMMSRRRSFRRKAVQMSNWDLQMSMRKKEGFGCFMFASGCSKMIEGLFDKKLLPRLKLV